MSTCEAEQEQQRNARPRGTGSLYERGGVWYLRYFKNGKRFRESAHTSDRRKAERLLQRRLAQIATGTFEGTRAERTKVGELADDFLRDYRINGRKSLDDVEARWTLHLKPFFAHYRASEVSTEFIKRYVDERQQQGAANATINRELAALKRMFRLGYQANKVHRVPVFPKLAERNVRTGFVEDTNYARLAAACGKVGLWLRAMLEVGYTYGWRVSELLNMKVRQVDLLGRTIRLEPGTTKNDDGREVEMTPAVATLLTPLCVGKSPDKFVFTRPDGSPVRDFRVTWGNVCCAAGLGELLCPVCSAQVGSDYKCAECKREWNRTNLTYQGLIFHDLRRTAARNLRRAGVAEGVIMKIGGWKTRSVFERYAIVTSSDISDALRKLTASRRAADLSQPAFQPQSEDDSETRATA